MTNTRLLVLLCSLMLVVGGCISGAQKPRPAKEADRLSLMYRTTGVPMQMKYPLAVGVLTLNDKRLVPFYGTDGYFREDIPGVASDMLFAELRSSGLFGRVVRIPVTSPERIVPEDLRRLAREHGVDMLMTGSVTRFNLMREKTGTQAVSTAKVGVDVRMACQLVYPEHNVVVWADAFGREEGTLAERGMVSQAELGRLAAAAMSGAFGDMKTLISQTGRRMAQ